MGKTKATYTIEITDEQIKLIRSYDLRAEQLYTRHSLSAYIDEDGDMQQKPLYSCYFCGKCSYESATAIPHTKGCIITLARKEFDGLNAQFIAAEHPE